MPEWASEECRRLIAARHGEKAGERALLGIQSVQWKIVLASYHAGESTGFLKPFTGSRAEMMRYLHCTASDEDFQQFTTAAVKSEAHLIACAAAVHSLADIMAQVVFVATGLSFNDIPEEKVGLQSVSRRLKELNRAPAVVERLEAISDSDAFKFNQAYVNTTKHRSLVSFQAAMSFGSSRRQGLKVMEFKYKESVFPATWFDTVADEYRLSIGTLIVNAGNALNVWLKNLE